MDARPWLDEVHRELVKRKLPPLYAERLLSELSDHITDFLEDPMSTDAKDLRTVATRHLGVPREVAATAAAEYRKGHFCRRHPIVSFLVMPIVALPILWGAALAVVIGLLSLTKVWSPTAEDLQWAGPVLPFVLLTILLLPVALAAYLFCRLARRAEIGWKWPLTACVLLAVLSGPAMVDAGIRGSHPRGVLHGTKYKSPKDKNGHGFTADDDAQGYLSFGYGVSRYPSFRQLMQFALPLVICAWVVMAHSPKRQEPVIG